MAEAASQTSGPDPRGAVGPPLVLASVAGLVVVRLFTDSMHVLPRALNFIDIPIMIVLAVSAAVRNGAPPTNGDAGRS